MRSSSGGAANRSRVWTSFTPALAILTCVRPDCLRIGIEDRRVESHDVDARFAHGDVAPAFDPRGVGHEGVQDEAAARFEVRRDVAEASHLLRLRRQHEERVEDDEDQPEGAVDGDVGHVAEGRRDRLAARLSAQSFDHRRRRVDAVHVDAERGEGNRDPTGADAQLERTPAGGEFGEDSGFELRVEAAVPVVVDGSDVLAVGCLAVLGHGSVLSEREASRVSPLVANGARAARRRRRQERKP